MIVRGRRIALDVPAGWDARIGMTDAGIYGATAQPLVHAANFALAEQRGEYGHGVVEGMTASDMFVSMIEFGPQSVGQALFANPGLPRQLDPDWFHPSQLQRALPGQAGMQRFFTEQGRAFCLYVVLGRYANRFALVPPVNRVLTGITVQP